jgi:mRNA-degrading endonuclease RelE of RelBE toxin-antitoxin system
MKRFDRTDEFSRDLKRLSKKYPSLEDDLKTAEKNAIKLRYEKGLDNASVFEILGCCTDRIKIAKVKKFACKSLKGTGVRSGIRVIFAYYPEESRIEYIEIYHKNEQANEDRDRIKDYLKSCS